MDIFLEALTIIFYEAVAIDLLKNQKLNGGSTIAIVEAKTTLARVWEYTINLEPLWVGNMSKSESLPREALQNFRCVSIS
jgi:mannose/fructose/N-acetylgalactosamine-specific phosphotransferase system component IIB